MIDTLANLLFRCSHRRLTRPLAPVTKAGMPPSGTYVVCLDCGKQFAYDLKEMKIGRPIPGPEGVLPPNMPKPHKKLKYALWASVPVAVVVGAALRPKKPQAKPGGVEPPPKPDSESGGS